MSLIRLLKLTGIVFVAAVACLGMAQIALAKSDKRFDGRTEFYGIIQEKPSTGFHGKWVIGGRAVISDSRTEFDQADGPLVVGGCAKVHIRNGRVHEIDSEPMHDCR